MYNDDIPVGRILSRRELLALAGAAGITLAGGGPARAVRIHVVATPALTEGPFFVDERLNRSNLAAGTTRPSVARAVPLELKLGVYGVRGSTAAPVCGAHVDIWHSDAIGAYSDEGGQGMQREDTRGQTWLRGYQLTDKSGAVTFKTIYPGWYMGRTPHIHFKVRTYTPNGREAYELTSQFFFDDTLSDRVFGRAPYNTRTIRRPRNLDDGIYCQPEPDGTPAGEQLTLNVVPSGAGYAARSNIGLRTG